MGKGKEKKRKRKNRRIQTYLCLGVGLACGLVERAPLGLGALGEGPLLGSLLRGGGLDLGGLLWGFGELGKEWNVG